MDLIDHLLAAAKALVDELGWRLLAVMVMLVIAGVVYMLYRAGMFGFGMGRS